MPGWPNPASTGPYRCKTSSGARGHNRGMNTSPVSVSPDALVDDAVALAHTWMATTADGQTAKERRTTGKLAALVADPAGLELAVRFVDRVARPHDVQVGAKELKALRTRRRPGRSSAERTPHCSTSARRSLPWRPAR